ncbi:acyl-CoA dehydrogenase family protein [Sphingomonas sp. Sphisp140]|uniref:acyl-CoA dehydrogenase family protein n=1 Tax=unclassified Sphingomonas TaxID=196159 RepID=UPI0039B0FBDE
MVNFELSEDQTMLRDMLQRYLREQYDFETRRARVRAGRGQDAALWQGLADLGILAVPLSGTAGGLGGGPVETMVVMEALGEALVAEPFLETVVIGGALLQAHDAELLPGIAGGAVRIAASLEPAALAAEPAPGGWHLTGHAPVVIGAPGASHLILAARTSGDGPSLFLVEGGTPGITLHGYQLIDDRPAADLDINVHLPAEALLGTPGTAGLLIETVLDTARAALCAEAVGVLRRMLDDTVAFAKQRRQFGQPLASFQALQHRMVDMFLALEQAVSASHLATLNLPTPPETRARAVAAAKATIGKAARFIGENAVQLHGAMGMTDELAVGHYFKRATVIAQSFGSTDAQVARYAALMRAA